MPAYCLSRRDLRVGILLTACILTQSSGCSWFSSRNLDAGASERQAIDTDFERSRLIVRDVVTTLVQIPSLSPRRTTLVPEPAQNRFGELLIAALQDAGYDLRIGLTDDHGNRLGWRVEPSRDPGAGPNDWTVLVVARDVRIKRSYRADIDGVRPVSAMFVHGADASRLTVDRSLFERGSPTSVVRTSPSLPTVLPERTAARSAAAASVDSADRRSQRQPTSTAPDSARPSNMYLTGRSRYQPLLATFAPIDDVVMVFPNDSLVMGHDNKRMARNMAARFDPGSDVISVIGCSHGKTALNDGNQVLANGRSWRVKEEFMRAGIDAKLVLEEGCWAGVAHRTMPARGVVVTHRRRTE